MPEACEIDRLRLVHPFPSLLNGVAVLAVALLAGGDWPTAVRLAAAMTTFQFAIGALNDLADASRDIGRRPIKPIAAGLVSRPAGLGVTAVMVIAGLVLTIPSGLTTLALGIGGLACGAAYDLRLSRTPMSWLPLALALPLVPLYAWSGAAGAIPSSLLAIAPLAVLAGAGLAIGNALADLEDDRATGRRTIAVRLGRRSAWRFHALALLAAAVGVAARPVVDIGAARPVAGVVAGVGLAVMVAGVALAARSSPPVRRVAWAFEAIATAILGVAWVLWAAP